MLTTENPIPQVKVGRSRATSSSVAQQQMALSQGIIPAVRGEYYSYASLFTEERPFYVLMKCKANKARTICEAPNLGSEVNAFFRFDQESPRILSARAAYAFGLLDGATLSRGNFDNTWFAPANLTPEQFIELRANKDTVTLVSVCKKVLVDHHAVTELHEGLVVALMTDSGKYGMFLVEEITSSSIQIEACHILI